MAWIYLFIAGLLECAWAVGLKYSDGFTQFWPTVFTAIAAIASLIFLGLAMRSLPIGTAYAIWTGIGAVGVAIFGIIVFGESAAVARIASIALIVLGIAGLKLFTPETA